MKLTERFEAGTWVRAAFCSEANFSHWADPRGTELEVSRILYPAPRSRHFEMIGGIFHSGDHFYLQVIEGPVESVEWYLERAEDDVRHAKFRLITADAAETRRFEPGTLRYVGGYAQLHALQVAHGLDSFNPYRYTAEMIEDFVALADEQDSARASR
ncbi:MAG: hypothetical protein GVY32_05465 [Gammaproteobacteria bacterium]|jgi:hypothetical protein|nr:hypothetical protein [Gammaproteobacteria bacterium]